MPHKPAFHRKADSAASREPLVSWNEPLLSFNLSTLEILNNTKCIFQIVSQAPSIRICSYMGRPQSTPFNQLTSFGYRKPVSKEIASAAISCNLLLEPLFWYQKSARRLSWRGGSKTLQALSQPSYPIHISRLAWSDNESQYLGPARKYSVSSTTLATRVATLIC
jgi:hypothetical protein